MYARLNMFTLGPGTRLAAEQLVAQFDPLFKAQKGLKSITFFGDDTVGEYASFSIWETREDAETANAALLPQLQEALRGAGVQIQGAPIQRIAEVYEPRP